MQQRVAVGPHRGAIPSRLEPISRSFGFDRGLPIDRYYIERFISANRSDIHGHVLEIGDDEYTVKYGGDRVTRSDVLHSVEGNPRATIVADLSCCDEIPADTFDCIILTQTLQMIYEVRPAIGHLRRVLKPGGVLLVTAHGISKIARRLGRDPWGEYWRFTAQSAQRLFEEAFPPPAVKVATRGNVLGAIASLHGLAAHELTSEEIDYLDPDYEVIITVRAVKGER